MDLKVPNWAVAIVQALIFVIIFFPALFALDSFYLQLPFFILELIMIFIVLTKKDMRFFYMFWQFQIYLLILFKVIFDYNTTFKTIDSEPLAIIVISFFITFLEALILVGFILREKGVKPILVTLSSTTSIVVLLIIIFIFKEGLPAFSENDPIEFLTGNSWTADYEPSLEDTILIEVVVSDYDHEISIPDDRLYLAIDENHTVPIDLKNTGSKDDTYLLSLEYPSGLSVQDHQRTVFLRSGSDHTFDIDLSSNISMDLDLRIIVGSMNGSISKERTIDLAFGDVGIDAGPEYFHYLNSEMNVPRTPFWVKNTGNVVETYSVTLTFDEEIIKPFVTGTDNDWDHDNDTVDITLDPMETVSFNVITRILNLRPFRSTITIDVVSRTDPGIYDSIVIDFEYRDRSYFDHDQTSFVVSKGSDVIIPVFVNITNPANSNFFILVEDGNGPLETFSLSYDSVNIDEIDEKVPINLSSGMKTLLLTVRSNSNIGGSENITLNITLEREGTYPSFGIGPMIVGTFITVLVALIIAVPLGLGTAIFLAEYCPKKLHIFLRPMFELLAGIPSIVYGLWGYFTLVPFFRDNIYGPVSGSLGLAIPFLRITPETPSSEGTVIVAGFVLSIMILPIIITLSEDSIRAVARSLKEGSLSLATTKWQTIRGVVLKRAKSGIISSIILAMGRAIGETMAVIMILRIATNYPSSLFERAGSMTAVIAGTFGWAFDLDLSRHAVFGVAIVLFMIVFVLNLIVFRIQNGEKKGSIAFRWVNRIVEKAINYCFRKKEDMRTLPTKGPVFDKKNMTSLGFLRFQEYLFRSLFALSAIVIFIFLLLVLSNVFITGISSMKLYYLFEKEVAGGLEDGGFLNAILGSLQLTFLALLISSIFSLGAAIYITQFSKQNNILTRTILFSSDTLAATPSIVFGAFGFIFFSIELKLGLSMLSAALTLSIMVIPLLLRSSIEALNSIPRELGDGSLALGASKWQTVWNVILPPALGGISSGVILSIGRAIGETAAILFTAGYALTINNSIMSSVATMPNMIYNYYGLSSHNPALQDKLYSCALVLIVLVLILNSIARLSQIRTNKLKGNY
ncbi:MAG: phosphate ABC transporter permease subunit PstC [Candidatus Thermoplasmatota archaeon]|nr:phosphate ABC transporter permease subunit PstC [Candidatus Thermoplasmatota archaeon]